MTTKTDRRQFMRRSGAALFAAGSTGLVAQSATAQTGGQQGVLADGFEYEPDYGAFINGIVSGRNWNPKDLEQTVDDTRNEFRANSDRWVAYGNWLLEQADVTAYGSAEIGVTFEHDYLLRSAETIETTLTAEYDDTEEAFIGLEWPLEPPEDPDFEVTLTNDAAENASDELSGFRREFIDPEGDDHELPSNAYLNELAGKYAFGLGVGEDARNVLEILLGWSP